MSKTLQQEIANGITQKFKDAVVKKIDKDNYLDIHLPSVHPKKGTHLGINTAKSEIKIVFYCREDEFVTLALNNSKIIEEYAQGLRIKGNPAFNDASKAIDAAIDFVLELMRVNSTSYKTEATESKTKVAVPKKAAPKKAVPKKAAKKKEENLEEEEINNSDLSDQNNDENDESSTELNDLFSKILDGNFTVDFVTDRPDLIAAVANNGDLNEVKRIIKEGKTDINVRDTGNDAYTAVHFAAWDGKVEILKYLIKSGADTDVVGNDGRTALHLAAVLGHVEAVEALLKAGVDIEKRIPDGNKYFSIDGATALRDALISQRWEVVEMLIKAGADISCLNEPCKEALRGKNDLFDVIRLLDEDGEYSEGLFDKEKLAELENKIKGDASNKKNIESVTSKSNESKDVLAPYVNDEIYASLALSTLLEIALDIAGESKIIPASLYDKSVLNKRLSGIFGVSIAAIMASGFLEDDVISLDDFKQKSATNINEIRDWYFNLSDKKISGILPSIEKAIYTVAIKWDDYMQLQGKVLCDSIKILANEKGLESDEGMKIVQLILDGLGISEEDWNNESETDVEEVVKEEEEIVEEEIINEQEEIETDETDTVAIEEKEDVADDFSFAEGKPYKKHFNRFLEISNKTGIHINEIIVEPNNTERDELWEITRSFADRIYQIDNDKNADQNELNFLCYYTIVSLHWCDIFNQNDNRYSYLNGRFRRDTVALALCFFTRIDRDFKYYDFIKESMVLPHMQFSVLMWTVNTIINNNQDTLFGLFTPKQAEQANDLFKQLTRKNGGADPIDPNDAPENHPLRSIWWEVYRQFNNVRIPYQFIKSYISQIPPKRTFFQNLFGSSPEVKPGMNVALLEEDRIKNVAYLEKQILHKQFPDDWIFINDLAFVSIYFATTTDGQLSEVEKNTIYQLVGEWITEEDENKKRQMVAAAFVKAKTEFDKDKSHERFEFALENIRRNFYVNYEYDEEKTHNQLIFVFNDLVAIANADDDEISAEVDLLKAILTEWEIDMSEVAGDDRVKEDTVDDSEEDEENNENSNDTDYPAFNVKMFENNNDKLRVQYLRNWQMASNVYCRRAGIRAFIPEWVEGIETCCPKFTKAQLESIEQIIRKNKIIPMLSYAPYEFFQQVKRVWWIVPFCIWREDSASWIMVDKNGLYCAHPEDNDISPMVSWENVTSVDLEFEYDGDSKVNMMTINFGEDQMLTYAEFVDENQGSYLSIVKAIYDVREKTIEESRGQQSWKEGAGGEGFKMFENPTDLLKKEIWLDNPERPNPKYFM